MDSWVTSGEGHPRRWPILAVLVVSLLVVVLDNTILNIALPTIQRDLNASQGELVWAIDSYILTFAALLFTMGVLGDKYGRKLVLMAGMFVFGAASLVCAFSTSGGMLIGWRAVMGIGGAAVMPTTLAIITVVFPPHERGKAIGMWAGGVGAAIALGPVLGGILLKNPHWTEWLIGNQFGSVFLINVPIVIVGLFFIWRIVPETKNPHAGKLDVPGLLISATGMFLLVYGIVHASETKAWLVAPVLVPIVLGTIILAVFVILEIRSDHASFDMSLFKNRGYSIALSAVTLTFFAMSGITFTLPFYFQLIRGMDTLAAGLCFLPFAVGQLLAAPRSGGMVIRFGYRRVMTTGLVLVVIALIGLLLIRVDTPIWMALIVFFIFGFGMGNVIAPASTLLQNVLPLSKVGAGSAVQNAVRQVGGALGVAIVGTVLATRYALNLDAVFAASPVPVPAPVQEAASESLPATLAVIGHLQGLPASLVTQFQNSAFDAYLSASHITTFLSLTIVVIAALLVGFGLPMITPPTQGAAPVGPPVDPMDELVKEEGAAYAAEAAQEYEQTE
ncbi:MAG: MFS transporter [Actinomycetota bacterium]|nr:MFS transporter [Actinomycetota bacterium]